MSSRRPRRIKKTPFLTKVKSFPFDLFLSINEHLAVLELDNLPQTYHIYLGLAADIIMILIRLYFVRFELKKKRDAALFQSIGNNRAKSGGYYSLSAQAAAKRRSSSAIYSLLMMTALALFAISVINTLVCFLQTKKYTLFGRNISNVPNTPSASLEPLETPADEPKPSGQAQFKSMIKKRLSGFITPALISPVDETATPSPDRVWVLNVWEPSLFHLNIFALFSPIHVIALWFGPLSIVQVFITLPAFSLALYAMSHMFLVFVKDKNIISGEVLGEFDKKVVHPLLGVIKQDAAVGADGSCEFYDAGLDNKSIYRQAGTNPSRPPTPVKLDTPTRRRTFVPTSGHAPGAGDGSQIGDGLRHFSHRLMDDRRGSSGCTPSSFGNTGPSAPNHTTLSGSPVGRPWRRKQ
ncbi:Meiotically up-regulated gene 154 protein [Yarrowia sp. C11]|nr:Meiotically up-regulated gene 154 protein [Yarrowia sp. C11]